MTVRGFRELRVWQKAAQLALECYRLARRFPREERYGLVPQIQRASVSVVANIAEGNGRRGRGEYLHSLSIARGSLLEVETHIELACMLNYVEREDALVALALADEVSRMLVALARALRAPPPAPPLPSPSPLSRSPADTPHSP